MILFVPRRGVDSHLTPQYLPDPHHITSALVRSTIRRWFSGTTNVSSIPCANSVATNVSSPWATSDPFVVDGSSRNDGQECLDDGPAICRSRLITAARAKRMDRAVSRTRLRDGRSPSVADMAILVSPCGPSSTVAAASWATEVEAIGGEFTNPSAVHPASVVTPGANAPADVAGVSPLLRARKLLLTEQECSRIPARHMFSVSRFQRFWGCSWEGAT